MLQKRLQKCPFSVAHINTSVELDEGAEELEEEPGVVHRDEREPVCEGLRVRAAPDLDWEQDICSFLQPRRAPRPFLRSVYDCFSFFFPVPIPGGGACNGVNE